MPRLRVKDALGNERVVELNDDGLIIGRGAGAGLILDDRHASRMHARISRETGRFVITDLQSGNGLFVNDVRVEHKALSDRDQIRIGNCLLQYEAPDALPQIRFSEFEGQGAAIHVRRVEDAVAPAESPRHTGATGSAAQLELEALRKKAHILTLMYELGRTLKGAISVEEIYHQVGRLLLEVCAADRVLILQRDGTGEDLSLAHQANASGSLAHLAFRTVSRTVTRKVMTERVTLLSSNAAIDPNLAEGHSIVMQQLRSIICAPLIARDEVQGVIYLDQEKVAAFTDDDLDVVNAVAAQTAIALENVHALERLTREAEVRAAYSRFLPAHVVEEVLQNPDRVRLGGSNQIATVFFADIRGFTRLAAQLDPEQVLDMLNEYFGEMTSVIFEHGGTLDKYIGDGLMALFGAPYATPDDSTNAVRAAISMQNRLELLKQGGRSRNPGWRDLKIGIGIDTGLVTVGYVGSTRRLDYTAIGDTVNIAARLENNAPAGAIYISRSTFEGLSGAFDCRELQIRVKGKDEPLVCYEVAWQ